jgi:FkbH-like protein
MKAVTKSAEWLVVGVDVTDRFGSYGTSGLIMIKQVDDVAHVDNFLLSCRVLGRGVELKAFDGVVDMLRLRRVTQICGVFRPTGKNSQVKDLYRRLGFDLVEEEGGVLQFCCDVSSYNGCGIEYISVESA